MDLVTVKDRVTLAIVDACPVHLNKELPPGYLQLMASLQVRRHDVHLLPPSSPFFAPLRILQTCQTERT